MQTTINQEYQVMQSLDTDDQRRPIDFQPAVSPQDPHASVRPVASLASAMQLMQRCFEHEKRMFPDTRPEEFRIEVTERRYFDLYPTTD